MNHFGLKFCSNKKSTYLCAPSSKAEKNAGMVKLVDMLDLGSSASRRVGSSPSTRTNNGLGIA